jgi:hypothetical protein
MTHTGSALDSLLGAAPLYSLASDVKKKPGQLALPAYSYAMAGRSDYLFANLALGVASASRSPKMYWIAASTCSVHLGSV